MNHFVHMLGGMVLGQMVANQRQAYEDARYPAPVVPQALPAPLSAAQVDEALRRLDTGEYLSPEDVAFMGRNLQAPEFDHITSKQIVALQRRILANMNEAA